VNDGVPRVVISDREPGLPYSKGLMASRVMATGLSAFRAYQVAERIEEVLVARGAPSVMSGELNAVAVRVLEEVAGDRYAKTFVRWQEVERLEVPIVLLIGGATGVGKSTIATQLAARLGIVRVVATDAIREVMRAMFSPELMPTLYTSSFEAGAALREPVPSGADKMIVGFREQTAAVAVGLNAVLERAAVERTSVIIEGAHVVPGFIDLEPWRGRFLAVPVVITVDDEDVHRSHFAVRQAESPSRSEDRYMRGFANIRKVQKFIRSRALSHGVPVIPNYSLDQTIAAVVDLLVRTATPPGDVGEASVGNAQELEGDPGASRARPQAERADA
jgi:2-phosphoglycerate kinase